MQFNVVVFFLVKITIVKKIQGKVIFRLCSADGYSKCCDQMKRDEYNEERWATETDGYLICGTCYDKLSDEICANCFCKIGYISVDEYCDYNSSN